MGICFTGTLVSLIGVLQYLFDRAELRWVDTARFGDIGGRVCGPFSNPNVFAVYLLGIAPLLLCECLDGARCRGWRLFCGAGCFLSATAIVFTFTRGAWLGILLSIFVFLVLFSRRSAALLCLSVLPIGALLPMLPHRITNRFLSIGSLAESSVSYRLHTWRGVLRMISRHRFGIGVGEQAFSCVYPRYAVSGTESVMHAHNLYLQILAESGMVGFLIFLALLGALLLCALWRLSLADGTGERTECLGALCALIGILTMAFFDHIWYHFGMLCWFFVIAAMLTLPSERILEREGLL